MQAMTPEQNDQWKAAIMPVALGVVEGFELTSKGVLESVSRLQSYGAPGWAIQVRAVCTVMGWAGRESWVPEFALRSEVALIGLQLRHSEHGDQIELYRRLFARFLYLALQPFVVWIIKQCQRYYVGSREHLVFRDDFFPLTDLYKLTSRSDRYEDVQNWVRLTEKLDRYVWKPQEEWSWGWQPERKLGVGADVYLLATECIQEARSILFQTSDAWWHNCESEGLTRVVERFTWQHQWRLDSSKSADSWRHINFTADAYLTALEAECPPPDWLPAI